MVRTLILLLLFVQMFAIYPVTFVFAFVSFVKLAISMLIIVLEVSDICRLLTSKFPKSAFLIVSILSFKLLVCPYVLEISFSVSQVVDKFTFVIVSIGPKILSLTIWSIFAVLPNISLSILVSLSAESLFL